MTNNALALPSGLGRTRQHILCGRGQGGLAPLSYQAHSRTTPLSPPRKRQASAAFCGRRMAGCSGAMHSARLTANTEVALLFKRVFLEHIHQFEDGVWLRMGQETWQAARQQAQHGAQHTHTQPSSILFSDPTQPLRAVCHGHVMARSGCQPHPQWFGPAQATPTAPRAYIVPGCGCRRHTRRYGCVQRCVRTGTHARPSCQPSAFFPP